MATAEIVKLPRRLPDWELRLHNFIESRKSAPFVWGRNDCCLFAADAVEVMTGVDIADKFRGRYDSEASCMALLESLGHADVEAMVRKELAAWQLAPVIPTLAHRGDLVLCVQHGQPALCVVGLEGKHSLGVGDCGLMKINTYTDTVQAWRVLYAGGSK